jgi:hypothetical protein
MVDRSQGLTAEERLAVLRRDQARLRRKRMLREIEGPRCVACPKEMAKIAARVGDSLRVDGCRLGWSVPRRLARVA